MALETATYINGLVAANPAAADGLVDGDNHIRLLKSTLLATFPSITGALTSTHTELNYVTGVTSAIQTQINAAVASIAAKAPSASPTLTGVPVAPTAAPGTNTTQISTTAFVDAARVILAAATALKADIASPTFTGVPAAPTAAPGTNTTQVSTTAFVTAAVAAIATGKVPHVTVVTAGVTFTTNAACTLLEVEAVAGGGGGGSSGASSSGLGGAAGGYARRLYTVVGNTAYTIAIGAGGTSTNPGSITTFTDGVTLLTATGGLAGLNNQTVAGGVVNQVSGINGQMMLSGATSRKYVNANTGSQGADGFGGPGGAGGGSNTNGTAAAANTGAGGGGAGDSTKNGGAGGSGYIIMTEYY